MNYEEILIYLKEVNFISIFLRLSLAVIFGGVIGYNREVEGRPAGLRTHILVSVGATLAMLTNVYIVDNFNGDMDPARIGAQVISGIGFLGAGTIIITGKNKVKGLTTAAGLWACASMGLAIGVGFYSGAIIGCAFIFIVSAILLKVDRKINKKSAIISLYILINSAKVLPIILKRLTKENEEIKIRDIEVNANKHGSEELIGVTISLRIPSEVSHKNIINIINSEDGVIFSQENI